MHLDGAALGENDDRAEGSAEVIIVEDEDGGQLPDGRSKIGEGAREAGNQLFGWDIVPSLADAHGDALFGTCRSVEPNEAEDDVVT